MHVLLEVQIQDGNNQYYSQSIHEVDDDTNPRELLDKHTEEFFGDDAEEDDGFWWDSSYETAVSAYNCLK